MATVPPSDKESPPGGECWRRILTHTLNRTS